MNPRKRIILLILIMFAVVSVVEVVTIYILYQTAFHEEELRLTESVRSQARLIEAVARFDKKFSKGYPGGRADGYAQSAPGCTCPL